MVAHTQLFFYDSSNRVVKIISYYSNLNFTPGDTSFVTYEYNSLGLLSSKIFSNSNPRIQSRKRIFTYDNQKNLIYKGYDNTDIGSTKYSYNSKGELAESIIKWYYTEYSYYYTYDSKGNLIEKSTKGGSEKYEYLNNKLVKEVTGWGEIIYQYDESGLLITKLQNNAVVEKNTYKNRKLIEKWTSYIGIDPCFRICCSRYIYRYSYY